MIVVSDLHVENFSEGENGKTDSRFPGCNSRALNILYAMERAYAAAVYAGTQTVVVPGDIFHRRGIIAVPLFNAVAKVFEQGREIHGVQTVVIPGNHDFADRDAKFADEGLHALWSMAGATVVSAPSIIKVKDYGKTIDLLMIPYTASKDAWAQSAANLVGQSKSELRYLFAHQSFNGAVVGPHEYIMKEGLNVNVDIPGGITLRFSGHYHKHQVVSDSLIYVGGIVQQNFGERTYIPGYLDVRGTDWKHIEDIESQRFQVVETNDEEDAMARVVEIKQNRDDIVQVRWRGAKKRLPYLQEAVDAKVVQGDTEETTENRIVLAGTETPEEMNSRYVLYMAEKGKIPVSAVELVGVGNKYLTEGRRNSSV